MGEDCTHIMLFLFCSVKAFVVLLLMSSTFTTTAEATTTKSTSPLQCSPVNACMYRCTCEGNPNAILWLLDGIPQNGEPNNQNTASVTTASINVTIASNNRSIMCQIWNYREETVSNFSAVLQGTYSICVQ